MKRSAMRGGLSPPQQQYEFMRGGGGQIAQIFCSNSMKSPGNIFNGWSRANLKIYVWLLVQDRHVPL